MNALIFGRVVHPRLPVLREGDRVMIYGHRAEGTRFWRWTSWRNFCLRFDGHSGEIVDVDTDDTVEVLIDGQATPMWLPHICMERL